jgi:hypothetical protein
MQLSQAPLHFRRSALVRLRDLARVAGRAMYFCLSCVLIGGCAVALYRLVQPMPNRTTAVSADSSTAPPVRQLNIERGAAESSAAERQSVSEAAFPSAIEPEEKLGAGVAQKPSNMKKSAATTASSDAKRKHQAPPRKHDPMMDYAAQHNDYRSWDNYQSWSGYRSSGNNQASGNYREWNNYQGWGGFRNGH